MKNFTQNLFISRIAFDETFQSIVDQQKFEVKQIAYYMKVGHCQKTTQNTRCTPIADMILQIMPKIKNSSSDKL